MPNVFLLTQAEATKALTDEGLTVKVTPLRSRTPSRGTSWS